MKENDEDYVKNWDYATIIGHAVSLGMMYMAHKITTKDLTEEKSVLVNEIIRRKKLL